MDCIGAGGISWNDDDTPVIKVQTPKVMSAPRNFGATLIKRSLQTKNVKDPRNSEIIPGKHSPAFESAHDSALEDVLRQAF